MVLPLGGESVNPLNQILSRLESHLQALIEGSFSRSLSLDQAEQELLKHLSTAMQSGLKIGQDDHLFAPDLYTLLLPDNLAHPIKDHPDIITSITTSIAQSLRKAGESAGYFFAMEPLVRVQASPDQHIHVNATFRSPAIEDTAAIPLSNQAFSADIPHPYLDKPESLGAYLIVDGKQIVPLDTIVLNIGRQADNHLVIDDLRISRTHAQIRFTQNQFMIFDLDSTGGTFVNGERVMQCTLSPGDLISLAGIPLVYAQESSGAGEDTQKFYPTDSSSEAEQ
jgi:hypothetical protein